MNTGYTSVNTEFHDKLEALALEQKKCEIIFLNEGGKVIIQGRIEGICKREGMEFLLVQPGLEIRLDKLVEVNGYPAVFYC